MQRILVAALVLLAIALSAGGVAFSVRADSPQSSAAPAQDRCAVAAHAQVIQVNAAAAARAAQDDMVPLNTQGYNYNAYDDQWRPEIPAAAPAGSAPAVPASPKR